MTNKIDIQVSAAVAGAVASLNQVDKSIERLGPTATESSKETSKAFDAIRRGGELAFGALVSGATASVKAASELQTSMTQIAALTDTPRAAIQGLTKDVIAMSRDIPVSANELAKGLYFVSSSGLKGADAMKVLRASATAAAAGLGETKTIADAVTSTLNAYQLGADQAARVTDVLTQAVKDGKGEPAEFAASLGRVLPIAAAAGVSMEQVAASMATMTRTGLSADEAATALRGTIGSLLAPSKQARDAFMEIGLTTADVAAKLKGDGLVSLLQLLMERTKGNVESLDAMIPNVRALTGVLSTAGAQGEAYAEILKNMENSAGVTDKAFATMSNTFDTKLKKAQNAIENLGIAVGNKLLPPLSDAAEAAAVLINWQDKLTEAFDGTEKQIQISSRTYDEYKSATEATGRAAGLVFDQFVVGTGTVTKYAESFHVLTEEQFNETRMLDQLTADLGDLDAYTKHVEANAEVGYQAILTADQLKEQAKATKEEKDALAEATIDNYKFIESFKDFSAVQGAKQTIADLEERIKADPDSRDKYAAQIRLISQQFGFTTVAMEAGAASFRTLEGLYMTGKISIESYQTALGKIKQAAADGKVSVDELGLKTGEAAAYMTTAAGEAKTAQDSIVNDARTNKQKMLDEMGNALADQQTKLQGRISDSMVSISNSLNAAKTLAFLRVGEIKDAWDRVPREVVTNYHVVHDSVPGSGAGFASGANFVVPPGYPNDSYPMRVQSGERVIVQTPQQQMQQRVNNMTMNVYAQSAPNVIDEFNAMRAMAGAL